MDDPSRPVRDSSGESSGPEKWFNESNNNVKRNASSLVAGEYLAMSLYVLMASDDPPFFLPPSCDTTPPDNAPWPPHMQSLQTAADDSFAANSPADSSAGAVYRNIIDDLTVENKKLKSTLRKYERAPDALFEVRVHGLSAQKKQELESLLQDFVTNIGPAPDTSPDGPINVPSRKGPASKSRLADSGYGSSNASALKLHAPDSANARRKNIQNYLHELPAGILPKRSGPLTEKEKRKIVVRSLEQLFAGRDPSSSGHQQPIQQERVAQSAARADRRATTGEAIAEGPREAHIMSSEQQRLPSAKEDGMEHSPQEQRPTRPLDLDPHRAQIPEENMQYIRHLGFSPPDAATMNANADSQGWISLIVLINMAQLHYTSVTPEFVRKSITEHSKMLELSPDGRKVRWRGGKHVTISSSGSSPDEVAGPGGKPPYSKPAIPNPMSSSDGSYFSLNRKLAYSPLFHSRGGDDSDDENPGGVESSYHVAAAGRSSTRTGSGLRSPAGGGGAGAQSSAADEGPIIFYRNAAFYTDLSGDHGAGAGRPPPRRAAGSAYERLDARPIGSEEAARAARLRALRRLEWEKGPLSGAAGSVAAAADPPGPSSSPDVEEDGRPASAASSLEVITSRPKGDEQPLEEIPRPIDFEVSGVGGVRPADNFAISVRSRQLRGGAAQPASKRSSAYPMRIRDALRRTARGSGGARAGERPVVDRQIVGSKRRELPASKLPEAVYFHASSSEEDDEDGDDSSNGKASDAEVTPDSQKMDWMAKYRGPGNEHDDGDDVEEDSLEDEESGQGRPGPALKGTRVAERIRQAASAASSSSDDAEVSSSSDEERPAAIVPAARRPKELSLKRARQSDESVLVHMSRRPKSPKLERSSE
jgi:hypothetical protein